MVFDEGVAILNLTYHSSLLFYMFLIFWFSEIFCAESGIPMCFIGFFFLKKKMCSLIYFPHVF